MNIAKEEQTQRVIQYYKECDWDYSTVWRDHESLGMHIGFWYDTTKTHAESLINHNIMMAKLANLQEKDTVLDAGCGVGGSAFWIANNFKANIEAISISDKQVTLAKKFAKTRDKEKRVRFSKKNYYATGFPAETFSVIWAQESLPHAENKKLVLREVYRTLKKGGRFISSDYFLAKNDYNQQEKQVLNQWIDSWAMKNFMTPEEFITLAKKTGFKKVKYYDTTALIKKSLDYMKRKCYLYYPIGLLMEFLKIRNNLQATSMRSPIYCYNAYHLNLWKHGIIYAEK